MAAKRYRRYVLSGLVLLIVAGLAIAVWQGAGVWLAWRSVERFEFDLAATRDRLIGETGGATTSTTDPPVSAPGPDGTAPGPPDTGDRPALSIEDGDMDVYLLVGTDADKPSADLDRADAIVLFVRPHEDFAPLLTSLPRDLYVSNACTGEPARLSTTLEGCRDLANGPELLALSVEDYTGLTVDHFAVLSFRAFRGVVDALGGVNICLPTPVRVGPPGRDPIELAEGCQSLDGSSALALIRDRTPQEYVDGAWRAARGGDQARSRRQQQLLVSLLPRLRQFRSPLQIANLAEDFSDAFALDDGLTLAGAIDLVWESRGIVPDELRRPTLEVDSQVTEDGEFVLVPRQPFLEFLGDAYAAVIEPTAAAPLTGRTGSRR